MKTGNNARKQRATELEPYTIKYPIEELKPDVVVYGGREIILPNPRIID